MENDHVLGYVRSQARDQAIAIANFSESEQTVPAHVIDQLNCRSKKHLHGVSCVPEQGPLICEPLDLLVLG